MGAVSAPGSSANPAGSGREQVCSTNVGTAGAVPLPHWRWSAERRLDLAIQVLRVHLMF
jgi:hypothetical protein